MYQEWFCLCEYICNIIDFQSVYQFQQTYLITIDTIYMKTFDKEVGHKYAFLIKNYPFIYIYLFVLVNLLNSMIWKLLGVNENVKTNFKN